MPRDKVQKSNTVISKFWQVETEITMHNRPAIKRPNKTEVHLKTAIEPLVYGSFLNNFFIACQINANC
jgi:hypothetical protein